MGFCGNRARTRQGAYSSNSPPLMNCTPSSQTVALRFQHYGRIVFKALRIGAGRAEAAVQELLQRKALKMIPLLFQTGETLIRL